MMCKLPWCSNTGSPLPFDGYCSLDHRDFHEYELEAEGYREEIAQLRRQKELLTKANEEYRRAIFNLYAVQGLGPGKVAEASWQLWKLAGVPKEDFTNVPG